MLVFVFWGFYSNCENSVVIDLLLKSKIDNVPKIEHKSPCVIYKSDDYLFSVSFRKNHSFLKARKDALILQDQGILLFFVNYRPLIKFIS